MVHEYSKAGWNARGSVRQALIDKIYANHFNVWLDTADYVAKNVTLTKPRQFSEFLLKLDAYHALLPVWSTKYKINT